MTEARPESGEPFGMVAALSGLAARGYAPEIVYDIGAAEGSWAELAAHIWPKARIVCFEPLEERRAALEELASRWPGRIDLRLMGVGDADGELALTVTESLWESSFAYGAEASQRRAAPVRRLDTLIAADDIPAPSFVKIDVQGFERRVLKGGAKALAGADFVLMECQFFAFCADMHTLDDTIGFMAGRGFQPYEFVDFMRRPLDGAMGQCDILFIRKTHALAGDLRWGEGAPAPAPAEKPKRGLLDFLRR